MDQVGVRQDLAGLSSRVHVPNHQVLEILVIQVECRLWVSL